MMYSVQFSYSVVSDSLPPHESQHANLPVHHQLQEFTQTQVHRVSDAIQPSHPLSNGILLSHKKEHNNAICSYKKDWTSAIFSNMNGLGGHYFKWNKSNRERQALYDITYM